MHECCIFFFFCELLRLGQKQKKFLLQNYHLFLSIKVRKMLIENCWMYRNYIWLQKFLNWK